MRRNIRLVVGAVTLSNAALNMAWHGVENYDWDKVRDALEVIERQMNELENTYCVAADAANAICNCTHCSTED